SAAYSLSSSSVRALSDLHSFPTRRSSDLRFRSYLQQFVLVDKVQRLFQGQDLRRRQTQRFIGGGRTGVGQMFRLADIQFDVLRFSVLSDDHAGVNLLARSDEEGSALLCGVKTVGDRLACLKRNQGTLLTVSDIAFIRCIIFELCIDDTRTFGGGHELSAETDQAAGRNLKFQAGGPVTCAAHTVQLAFSFAEQLDDCAGKFIRNVHISNFHRLQLSAALVFLVNNLCLADCKFITLTAHVLDQYGQMQL